MSRATENQLERLTEEAVEHLRLIHKYTAWMAFFVVLAGVVFLIGLVVTVLNAVIVVG